MVAGSGDQFVFAAVADQRRQFASLIDGLDEAQLATPSLCLGWDVKTVAAHVVSTVVDGMPGFLQMAVRCGGLSRGIDVLARRRARAPIAEIVAALHEHADRPITSPVFGRGVRWPTSWCTPATSGFRSVCRSSPMCSGR